MERMPLAKPNRHLIQRGENWYYKRRVPRKYRTYETREFIRKSLDTSSLEIARLRRDALERADNEFWANALFYDDDERPEGDRDRLRKALDRKYEAARSRAMALGFVYAPAEELAATSDLADIMDRLERVSEVERSVPNPAQEAEAAALLGGVAEPKVLVSDAFDIYCNEIAIDELIGKSDAQKAAWKKTKNRGIQYFIDVVGDKPMREITRQDAQVYYNWWKDRVVPKPGKKALSTKTANRDLGNMRKLFGEYFKYAGEEERQNPFRNLSFKDKKSADVPPFEDAWVREKVLVPGVLSGLRGDAHLIAYALIETGCRPGEIANLLEDDIHLEADVPFISIRPREDREIKTASSIRDIPLVGVSLEAMKQAPKGFPHYRDKPDLLSSNLITAFKSRNLFPTPAHKIYSFRHSFEKRMQEAELDYGFRCMMMGHRNTRPTYGDGGSMEYRRDQLLKIVHPVPDGMF